MDFPSVYKKLEEFGTEQNRKIYRKHGAKNDLFGVSFANLNKIKKEIVSEKGKKGTNHGIAQKLWETKNTDAMTLAAMIADPELLSPDEAEEWVTEINYYPVSGYFAELVAKTSFAEEKAGEWINSKEEFIQRAGYEIINYFARKRKDLDNAYFEKIVNKIVPLIQNAPNRAKEGMNNCLIAIGGRNNSLKEKVFKAADKIGSVEIDHGDTSCQTFDITDYVERMHARTNSK